ncbi:MAG: acetyl-CoA hydrolase/transferase C-terminal domain-containing protein [Nocardioidaceae bacterium]
MTTRELDRLLAALPPRPRVVVSGNAATPWTVLREVDEALETYVLHLLNPQAGVPDRDGVTLETPFVGPGARRSPRLAYLPSRLSMVPLLYASRLPPDVVLLHTSLPHDGTVSMGTEVNVLPAAVEAVRRRGGLVIAQVDPAMPYVYGDGVLPLTWVDHVVEASDPPGSPVPPVVDDASRGVAENVARRIGDGATLQTGIGSIPDAVLSALGDRRGLRVWSEMISDGMLDLEKAGSLDRDREITCSFLFGTPELYAWADHNPRLRLRRTEVTNDPTLISTHDAMVSVNTALQVDLYAQVNASRVRGRPHSGFGGQTDFIVGALHAPRGQAVIALRSWHPRADVSTIVPMLEEPVTSFQPSAVVTEQGTAELWGRSDREQAEALISGAAHPDAREELAEEGRALGLLD